MAERVGAVAAVLEAAQEAALNPEGGAAGSAAPPSLAAATAAMLVTPPRRTPASTPTVAEDSPSFRLSALPELDEGPVSFRPRCAARREAGPPL